jgi:hypothetical protein
VIDSVLDFDYASGRTDTRSADAVIAFIRDEGLEVEWLLETHVHADHLSAAPYIQRELGGKIGIGRNITIVQDTFGKVFNEGTEFQRDGSQFDRLFDEGDSFHIGQLRGDVLHTPGHTPACLTYVIGDAAFRRRHAVHARFRHRALRLPRRLGRDDVDSRCRRSSPCPTRRASSSATTTRPRGATNTPGKPRWASRSGSTSMWARARAARISSACAPSATRTLGMPRLIIPSLQVNMRAGQMPPAEDNGDVYLKVPVNKL